MKAAVRRRLVIPFLLGFGLTAPTALALDDAAVARRHAAKGHNLAAKNDCPGAVAEFTRAYVSIHDPALLFSRAECYRKLGMKAEAASDYEQFLAMVPNTPNRASIEARIASLRGADSVRPTAVVAPPASPATNVAVEIASAKKPGQSPDGGADQTDEQAKGASKSSVEKWTD